MATAASAAAAAAAASVERGGGATTDGEKASAVEIFKKTWDVYTKVVEHDYMSHVLLFDSLSRDMMERHGGDGAGTGGKSGENAGGAENAGAENAENGFSIVDLGCGGADALAGMLRRNPPLAAKIASYTGVDLSDIALAHARANMLGGPVGGGFPDVRSAAAAAPDDAGVLPSSCASSFVEQDMVSFARSLPEGKTDVILAAFALHHLAPDLKKSVLEASARALKPKTGTFYYLDVWMRDESTGETREAYLLRYKSLLDGWPALSENERQYIWDHVSAFDFPCDEGLVAASPFFERCEAIARDGGPHALLRLTGPVVVDR